MTEWHFQSADQRPSRLPYWTPESPTVATAHMSMLQKMKSFVTKPLFVGLMVIFMIVLYAEMTGPLPTDGQATVRSTLNKAQFEALVKDLTNRGRAGTDFQFHAFTLKANNPVFAKMNDGNGRNTSYVQIFCPAATWKTDATKLKVCKKDMKAKDQGLCDKTDELNGWVEGGDVQKAVAWQCKICTADTTAEAANKAEFPTVYHDHCKARLRKTRDFVPVTDFEKWKEPFPDALTSNILVMLDGDFTDDLRPNTNPRGEWPWTTSLTGAPDGYGALFVLSAKKMFDLQDPGVVQDNIRVAEKHGFTDKDAFLARSEEPLRGSLTFGAKQGAYYAEYIDVEQ